MTKVTAPLLCSRKHCKRETVGGWKKCQRCRDIDNKSKIKWREKATKQNAKEGHRICKNCCAEKPEHQYRSCHSRRQSLTASLQW